MLLKSAGIFLFTLMIAIPASAQFLNESQNTPELIKANRVKSETIYQSTKSFRDRLGLIKNYDSSGNLILNRSFTFREQLFSSDTFIYNSNSKCTKKIRFGKNGIIHDYYIYTYNDKGNLSLIEIFRDDTLLHSQKKIYNENDQHIIDSSRYDKGGYFESFLLFYNEDGLKTKCILNINADSSITTDFKYNKKKMLVEKYLRRTESEVSYIYSYNSHDQCKKEKRLLKKEGKQRKQSLNVLICPKGF